MTRDSSDDGTLAPREAADGRKETINNRGEVDEMPEVDINVTTPSASEAIARQAQIAAGTSGGYFDQDPGGQTSSAPTQELKARASQSQSLASSTTNRSTASLASTSNATAPGHIELPGPQTSLAAVTRPPPHTTQSSLSIESATSNSTITPEHPNARPQRPAFPNQALSALHTQDHGRYYLPPSVRRGGTQPHQISTFASAIASLHSSGVRTAHNSPAVTPGAGLFNPSGPPSAPAVDTAESTGTYASPFLHFTHTHVPKETHVADVDVDPVSGRKLINHYEIIDELGRGTHGKVKLGRDLESPSVQPTYVAIKIVERFSKRRKLGRLGTTEDKVKKEVAILKKARHPNVVALLEVIDDPSRKKVYIVLEWVERGEINWRVKGPKEIALIEARRFEREKHGTHTERDLAEDSAVLTEVQKRLQRQKRHQLKAYRQMKRGAHDAPEFWSVEMMGDNESEESEEDRISRISSLTAQSDAGRLAVETPGRRASRTPSPLQASESDPHYLSLTSEPETMSPTSDHGYPAGRRPSSAFSMSASMSGLEGTMYGPYDPVYSQTSRVASLNSLTSSRSSTEGLTRYATEMLETPLDSELEYVPVMTMEQIRVAFRDTLLGLQYLHYQGIVHRDIKPPNLLATIDNRVKISDFGVSYLGRPVREGEVGEDVSEAEAQDLDDEAKELAKTVGTPAFYAPELCITDPTDDPLPVTKAIDVWALGVTLFCMLFARTPFVDNEFVVMRQIADEDIYLPRRRLQPVDLKPKSRPSSHGRAFPPLQNGRRHELDLVYEEIDDDLHDLMKRLLTKDPRKRITLEEVRHHPWVVADLTDKVSWLEETDPSRQAEGKKIEVSKEELNTAVVPLNLVERMRSGVKKILDRTGITRTRGQSNASAGKEGSPVGSANSSSTTISQDARRQSMRGDESIYNALHKYREGEHPLSRSVAASPELEKTERYFDKSLKPNGTEEPGSDLSRTPSRPSPPARAMTIHSAAGSMRTVTQSDYHKVLSESPPPSPGLPGTPMALASPSGSHLSGIFGGPSRLIKSVRERSTQSTRRSRAPSSSRGSAEESDHHAEASIAVSHASAAGHVHAPETLDRFTPNSSAHNSPASSRPHSVVSDHLQQQQQQHLQPLDAGSISRKSSTSSLASVGRRMGETFRSSARSRSRRAPESSAEDWKRADEERVRKLVREGREELERGKFSPSLSESPRAFEGGICPTSPDDLRPKRDDSQVPSLADSSNPETPADMPSEGISPTHQTGQLPPALVSSSSDLGSAVSMSISNPSIPSVISEASSFDPREEFHDNQEKREPSSDDTLNPSPKTKSLDDHMDEGYSPDQEVALDTDRDEEFDSSSDSDGGLVMSRRKSAAKGHGLVVGSNTPKERRGTGLSIRSKKSSRSGSNNTMKKVRTRESGDERRSLEISEE